MDYKPTATTYSFADTTFVLAHPSIGQMILQGKGLGSVTITRAADASQQDVAADGSVMTSKIINSAGTIALNIQQSSEAHKWLSKAYAYLVTAPTSEWARMSAVLRNSSTGENVTADGICFQKRADVGYQAAGQQVAWNLMAADISG